MLAPLRRVLVDDLQAVVVYVPFVQQGDVPHRAIVAVQHLHVVFLNKPCLLHYTRIGLGQCAREELFPFSIGKLVVVQFLQLSSEVLYQFSLGGDVQVLVSLALELLYESLLQCCLALVLRFLMFLCLIPCHHGAFRVLCY